MRQALRGSAVRAVPSRRRTVAGAGQTVLTGATIPAPIKGWDASSPLANMDPAAAIVLDNWFPEPAFVRLRAGHELHATLDSEGNDSFTKVLLHFDGADASTTITDTNHGGTAHTWAANGNAQIDTAQSKFGGASGLFDGTGDFGSTADSADFTLGSSDFTIDFWFRAGGAATFESLAGQSDGVPANSAWDVLYTPGVTGQIFFSCYQGASTVTVVGTTEFTSVINPGWHHCAVTRSGTTLRLFFDGVQEGGNVAITGSINNSAETLRVGDDNAAPGWNGHIDEFRFSVGIARWTTTFTPPTVAYDLVTSGPCESLMAYHGPSGTTKLFAARDSFIFDATATSATLSLNGLTNARWQHCHQTSSGGNFLVICNGADLPRNFNGTVWSTPSITGVTASIAIHVNVHKRRLWFTEVNSTKAFYLPVDSIAGAAVEFDFGPLMSRGGYLMATATWTHDGGWGEDDFFVAITSKGQVMIYAGNDPSSADDWFLKGVFEIGAPIGRRCFSKVGGDLAVITVDGVVPLSQAILMDRSVTRRIAITGRISRAMNEAARDAKGNFGWQLQTYPLGTAVLLNVPITEDRQIHQYVMNPLTGAWCRYTGMNAVCWEIYLERIFFGGIDGNVYEADVTGRDNGELIVAEMKTAFNYFNSRGVNKQYRVMRALMSGDGEVIPNMTLNTDYRNTPDPVTIASTYTNSGAQWGAFNWGDGTLWAGSADLINLSDWVSVENEGHCAAVRCRVAAANENEDAVIDLRLQAFDILYEKGGFV